MEDKQCGYSTYPQGRKLMILEAQSVTKEFIRKRKDSNILEAVKETSLTIEEGSFTVLAGYSGSGKSTLLNMLAGLLVPTSGKVLLDGQDIYALEDKELSLLRNKHYGIIPQGQSALAALTVRENILMPVTLYGRKVSEEERKSAKEYAKELMERTGIADLGKEMPSELSGGEIRRMAICRALINRPEIVFADEPTGDLDRENTEIVLGLLKEISEEGAAVFLVSHDRDVFPYADSVYMMEKGVMEACGLPGSYGETV